MRQLLKLEIDTCRVKGQIWTQQDLSIVNATIQHTSDIQTQLQFNNLTCWFTHLISWFTHQISATGQNALHTAEYQLLPQRYSSTASLRFPPGDLKYYKNLILVPFYGNPLSI